jgi:two-component system sensor histidine kinase RegB
MDDSRATLPPARTNPRHAPPPPQGRVRLRTLVVVRWVAIFGQTAAVLYVQFGLGFHFQLFPTLGAIAISAVLNAVLMLDRPLAGRLDNRAAGAVLAYDVMQLATLLYFTGGLQNPFAVLLVAPVAVAAASLSRAMTAALGALALFLATLLAFWHEPLPWSPPGLVLPLRFQMGVWIAIALTIGFVAAYVATLSAEARQLSDAFSATQALLAREQRMSAVGGLAAAAAHELGTPLATIAVVAKEIARDLPDGELRDDAELLLAETMRCRDILARLAAKPEGGGPEGNPFPKPAMSVLLKEIAERYGRGVAVAHIVDFADGVEPAVRRTPEIVQALGTLIENAATFARKGIEILVWSDAENIGVDISDDGPGFSPDILGRLGEPYVSTRIGDGEHMGLGIFIANTLLSRTGGAVSWENRREGGARVSVRWPKAAFG